MRRWPLRIYARGARQRMDVTFQRLTVKRLAVSIGRRGCWPQHRRQAH